MKLKLTIFLLLLLFTTNSYGQYNFKNKKEVAVYNIVSNGIIGGIGALINNKHKYKNIVAFGKGFYKGAISGAVIYAGKDLISEFPRTNNYGYLWGSKLLTFTGSSMLENTIQNKKIFENLHYNIGFVRFDIYPYKKFNIKPHVMPYSLLTTIWLFTKYNLDVAYTLKTGNFVFTSNNFRTSTEGNIILGTAFGNNIFVTSKKHRFSRNLIVTHEIIHVFQLNSFSYINPFFQRLENKWFGDKKIYQWYHKYFYSDYENLPCKITYNISQYFYNMENNNYSKNIFEGEAFMMSQD